MKVLKTVLLTLLVSMLASSAWAVNFYYPNANWADTATHIKMAPNNKGDILIFPVRLNDPGLTAKFTVANTSLTQSTVAKVVVRSEKYSGELLDFLIYLSPGDVWTGRLWVDPADGLIKMWSTDDSVQHLPLDATSIIWASEENPMNEPLRPTMLEWDEVMELGYVTVINIASTSGIQSFDAEAPQVQMALTELVNGANVNRRGVSKTAVKSWYDRLGGALTRLQEIQGAPNENYDSKAFDKNILAGWMDFQLDGLFTSRVNATTFRDHRQTVKAGIGQETFLGNIPTVFDEFGDMVIQGVTDSLTELAQVEAALAKDDIVMPYVHDEFGRSLHFFLFPTKYATSAFRITDEQYVVFSPGPYFIQNAKLQSARPVESPVTTIGTRELRELCVPFKPLILDTTEKSPTVAPFSPLPKGPNFCDELNWIAAADVIANIPQAQQATYDRGVIHISFGDTTKLPYYDYDWDVNFPQVSWVENRELVTDGDNFYDMFSYSGAPVIPLVLDVGFGLGIPQADVESGLSLAYGAWSDGTVTVQDIEGEPRRVPFYQYADDLRLLELIGIPWEANPENPNYR